MYTLDLQGKIINRGGRTYDKAEVRMVNQVPVDGEQNNEAIARLFLTDENGISKVQDGIMISQDFVAQAVIDAMTAQGWFD